jgi:hypothetical protein
MKPYVASGVGDFLRKVVYDYVRYGYVFYALREIPLEKAGEDELRRIDAKLIQAYGVTYNRTTRMRRAEKGLGNVAYVRCGRWFVILGTDGEHGPLFQRMRKKHFEDEPLFFAGYVVQIEKGRVEVKLAPRRWKQISELGGRIALHNERKVLDFFHRFLRKVAPFSFPGVVRQKEKLLEEVNARRKTAGLSTIPAPVWWGRREGIVRA